MSIQAKWERYNQMEPIIYATWCGFWNESLHVFDQLGFVEVEYKLITWEQFFIAKRWKIFSLNIQSMCDLNGFYNIVL